MIFDAIKITGVHRTADGFMVADARVSRSGIQEYLGIEVDPDNTLGLRDKQIVRVYRPEDEVFGKKAMQTYAHRPVTNDHPSTPVTAENWKRLSIGSTGGEVARDGDWVRVPLVLMDAEAIAQVEGGKRELSMGYTCSLTADAGITPDGQQYDAIQRDMRMNHLAVVRAARAGSEARIGDDGKEATGTSPTLNQEKTMTTKAVVLGDKVVQVADADVAVFEDYKRTTAKIIADMQADHEKVVAGKDVELAKKDGEIRDLNAKVLDDAAMDARVTARADMLAKAKALVPDLATAGLSDAAVHKAVVVKHMGDAAVAGKSDAYIEACFDMLAKDAAKDAQSQDQLRQVLIGNHDAATTALSDQARYEKAISEQGSKLNARFKTA